jgi:anti-sigma factor RsiW
LLLWNSVAFGATAFALLAVIIRPGVNESDQLMGEAVSSHVRSLMADHLTDVSSSDQHTVKPWFNGKLDFAPNVKDFAAQGCPLVGGRLDYLGGRPVAALVYRHNKHFINVFVWPAGNAATGRSGVEHRRGYAIMTREAEGLRYCLVSDLNQQELVEFAGWLAR